ncbi:hypothetical protein FA10DRAFT_266814 [Acaromyces ingoldii]|uniref:Uncharacterized protein n=1 Tax=Acaromyces ingoldii TaxID=215250 RepID=A0A316YRB9_9BASI|nr:hypothetical protein FA10DRAFT_266814 [Acaromyces ingoldii]PWN90325.1 hypothetical protein FA10DRAFT_266814 [Acaromyces ingoldii]
MVQVRRGLLLCLASCQTGLFLLSLLVSCPLCPFPLLCKHHLAILYCLALYSVGGFGSR